MPLNLSVLTPDGPVLHCDVDEVTIPGQLGEFGVLEGHIPFLTAVKPGVLHYRAANKVHTLAVGPGFAEVGVANKVLVLTNYCARPGELDTATLQSELTELENDLKNWHDEINDDYNKLREKIAWVQAELDTTREK